MPKIEENTETKESKVNNVKRRKPKIKWICVALTCAAIFASALYLLLTAKHINAVYISGIKVGYSLNTEELDEAMCNFYSSVFTVDDGYEGGVDVSYEEEIRIIGEPRYISEDEFIECLSEADENVSLGYKVFLNGEFIAIVENCDIAERALEDAEDKISAFVRKEYPEIDTVDFSDGMTFERTVLLSDELCDYDRLEGFLTVGGDIVSVPAYKAFADTIKNFKQSVQRTENEAEAVKMLEKYLREYSGDDEIEYKSREYYTWLTKFIHSDDYNNYLWQINESLGLNKKAENQSSGDDCEIDGNSDKTDYFLSESISSLLSFSATFTEKITEKVTRETETVDVEYRKVDYKRVTKAGSDGIDEVEYSVKIDADGVTKTELKRKTVLESVYEEVTVGTSEYTEAGVATGTMLWPVETIGMLVTSYFGEIRDDYDTDGEGHRGVDLCGYKDEPVYAVDGGVVIESGFTSSYGYHVKIDHGNGFITNYAHMYKNEIDVGEKVYQGQIIGHVGSSGVSSNYHLHFEVRKDGSLVDPIEYLYPIDITYYLIP